MDLRKSMNIRNFTRNSMSLMKISYDFKISKRLRRLNNFSWQKNDFFYDFGMRKIRMIFYARICLNIFSPINILYFIIFNFNKCENLASGWTSLSRRGWTSQLCSHSPGFRWAQAVELYPERPSGLKNLGIRIKM